MTIKVRMYPHLDDLENHASGIAQVIKHYFKYLPDFGVELVARDATSYDLEVAHAAAQPGAAVLHCHGLMWTGEFELGDVGHGINRDLVRAVKLAREVTVPSAWVARPFQRDMRFTPHIIPHGVEWEEWQHNEEPRHILWAKNRRTDGLDPEMIVKLANRFPDYKFVSTFGPRRPPENLRVLGGAVPFGEMKKLIQQSLVFVASDRETFGIGPLEAMAAGVPVLTVNEGEVPNLIDNGSLFCGERYETFEQACLGLEFLIKERHRMGRYAREIAQTYSWKNSVSKVADVYRLALVEQPASVDVVIPCHNYHEQVKEAVRSAMAQPDIVKRIIVVDDSSSPPIDISELVESDNRIKLFRVEFGNVALTRNYGAAKGESKYITFLDADDQIEPGFTPLLANNLEESPAAGIAYTSLLVVTDEYQADTLSRRVKFNDGRVEEYTRDWPTDYDYARQLERWNQIPSGCMVRREAFERCGGFSPLYCPDGAGSEDAELWLRIGAAGWRANYVTDLEKPSRWIHFSGHGHVSGKGGYEEPDWTAMHPWTKDGRHPFASIAEPANIAHPVYSYEKPLVSIIVPVGKGHEQVLMNCLHSIEGQTMREWEVIVVWDGMGEHNKAAMEYYEKAFPYVNWRLNQPRQGAGAARNNGIRAARGKYLTFVDADDRLLPEYLAQHLAHHEATGAIAYSDFVALVRKDVPYGLQPEKIAGDYAYYRETAPDWNCQEATAYPEGKELKGTGIRIPFTAAGTNIFLPRDWMILFDEKLKTWEDNLLVLQLSWAGRKFSRIPTPLWVYDMGSGRRRQQEVAVFQESLAYIQARYNEVETMCQCDNEKQQVKEAFMPMTNNQQKQTLDVIYDGKGGERWLTGMVTNKRYARVTRGDRVDEMDKRDVFAIHSVFLCAHCGRRFQYNRVEAWCDCPGQNQVVETPVMSRPAQAVQPKAADYDNLIAARRREYMQKTRPSAPVATAPEPAKTNPGLLSSLDINFSSLKALEEEGLVTIQDALDYGQDALLAIPGVGPATVQKIMGAMEIVSHL